MAGVAQVTFAKAIQRHAECPPADVAAGSLRAVLRGEAEQRGVFFVGCSGSTWRVRNRLAGIQFAASEDLRIGFAQAAFAVAFEWLKQQFGQTPEIHRAF